MKVTDTHVYFYQDYYSQWDTKHGFFDGNGIWFNCAEQYMMWNKAIHFGDMYVAGLIMSEKHPRDQKAWGKKVAGYVDKEWEDIRFDVVVQGNVYKFSQNKDIKYNLLTLHKGKNFVEASPVDPIWGVGLGENDPLILDEENWKGLNLLGKAINKAREIIITL